MKRLTEVLATPAIPLGVAGAVVAAGLSLTVAAPAQATCLGGTVPGAAGFICDNGPGPGWNNGPGGPVGYPGPPPGGWDSWNNPGPQFPPPPRPINWNGGQPPAVYSPGACTPASWDNGPGPNMVFALGADGRCQWYPRWQVPGA